MVKDIWILVLFGREWPGDGTPTTVAKFTTESPIFACTKLQFSPMRIASTRLSNSEHRISVIEEQHLGRSEMIYVSRTLLKATVWHPALKRDRSFCHRLFVLYYQLPLCRRKQRKHIFLPCSITTVSLRILAGLATFSLLISWHRKNNSLMQKCIEAAVVTLTPVLPANKSYHDFQRYMHCHFADHSSAGTHAGK
jgi:hypothetical protein